MGVRLEYRLSGIVVCDASNPSVSLVLLFVFVYIKFVKKQGLLNDKSCFFSINYLLNPVESICKLGSFLILVYGIRVKNRVLLLQWKKLEHFVLSL